MIAELIGWICFVVLLPLLHRIQCRSARNSGGRQKGLFYVTIALNVPLVVFWILCNPFDEMSAWMSLASLSFLLISYNSFGYAYFHVFNMSETARRIRLLNELCENNTIIRNKKYTIEELIDRRLERLVELGQITHVEPNGYRLSSNFLLSIGRLFQLSRGVVMGRQISR